MKQYYKLIDEQMVFFHEPLLSNDMQIFNPTEEQILNEGWIEYVIPEPEPEPISDPTPEELLQQTKNAKITEIDAYNDSSNVNGFVVNGHQTWIPRELRANFKASIDSYIALEIPTMTKIWEGIEYTTAPQNWLQMYYVVEYYASECQNVTDRHKITVNAMNSIEDIEAFDIAADYPNMPEFTISN